MCHTLRTVGNILLSISTAGPTAGVPAPSPNVQRTAPGGEYGESLPSFSVFESALLRCKLCHTQTETLTGLSHAMQAPVLVS